ncbi:MAG TPA: hypothetical protein VEJ18_09840 [Planctomycetota bacterium]|nr:hypothetical protein [Planctomycetota bacterium]
MFQETALYRALPRVSVGRPVALACAGLGFLLGGIAGGTLCFLPSGILGTSGLVACVWYATLAGERKVWLLEGPEVLLAATLANGGLALGSAGALIGSFL